MWLWGGVPGDNGAVTTRILLLGSTGSIGTQALEVMADNPDLFSLAGIAAGGANPQAIVAQAQRWGVPAQRVAVADAEAARQVAQALGGDVISGPQAAQRLVEAASGEMDVVLNALVGSMGLAATLAALATGARLALANKESLVAGGQLVLDAAAPGQLVPVDSEHSAMAQCLRSGRESEVARLVLTASGGPFRGWDRDRMWEVTPQQAAAHPTWSMGQMNTLNSATLVNKGLELVEASLLFGIDPELIDVVVHPQSIVHSMVTFCDGATIAQASPPSMKLPIALALGWPDRVAHAQPALDFSQAQSWTFDVVDDAAFPAVNLAREVISAGKTWPAVYNAANEQAAAAFLAGRIRFPQIVDVVEQVVGSAASIVCAPRDVADVLGSEAAARRAADAIIAGLS